MVFSVINVINTLIAIYDIYGAWELVLNVGNAKFGHNKVQVTVKVLNQYVFLAYTVVICFFIIMHNIVC